ncbi:hypothetical protein [Streptomyces sp. TUS-ST3]|uniref:hypothetical protein n=1 Tax=Streptomyces sp. TUS-ST3 TaxID=3025591 RepID=UPI0024E0CA4B|nr:hypothetical protein [Streptomyces sp. TUS-ST3]
MFPFFAQGAAQSSEDAAVLARCLGSYTNDPEQGLKRYEAARIERTTRLQAGDQSRPQGDQPPARRARAEGSRRRTGRIRPAGAQRLDLRIRRRGSTHLVNNHADDSEDHSRGRHCRYTPTRTAASMCRSSSRAFRASASIGANQGSCGDNGGPPHSSPPGRYVAPRHAIALIPDRPPRPRCQGPVQRRRVYGCPPSARWVRLFLSSRPR